MIECYAMLSGEEPQHTDLSTVIECYAISSGEELQHTDFQLWCSRRSVFTVSLLTLTLTLQSWTLHLSIWVAPYLSELSKIIEITKLEV